ncbi:MAG TPA: GreA/GreB family elongation factor [Candidatus Saccharimonadia bacterium]|nr:GreA/GreB family elongation factor [Candidatus Saccharimonadia bacterium]
MHSSITLIPFTREAYEHMHREVARLQHELDEVKVRLQTAREMGDLSENGAYHAAKFELGSITRELRRLRGLLKQGKITERAPGDGIGFGSTVTLKRDNRETSYLLVSMHESDPKEHKLSMESPLGKAVLGKHVGEVVEVQTPGGKAEYSITAIK